MKKLIQLLVALMLMASVGLMGCSGEQGERDRDRGTGTEMTTTPDGGVDTDEGLGEDSDGTGGTYDGTGDTDKGGDGDTNY